MKYHSDYQDYLFNRAEVAALLESAGYPLQSLSHSTDEGNPLQSPEWMRIYAAKSALRPHEAAWIIEGEEPPDNYPHYPDTGGKRAERRALSAIIDSVLSGDLEARNTQWHIDDEPQSWLIDHRSLIEWCQRAGYEWPLSQFMEPVRKGSEETGIPEPPAQSISKSDRDALNRDLDSLRQEVAELRATIEEIKKRVPLHPGRLMGIAIEAQHKHWQDLENRPKADGIVSDLKAHHGLSGAQARAVEAVACPIER